MTRTALRECPTSSKDTNSAAGTKHKHVGVTHSYIRQPIVYFRQRYVLASFATFILSPWTDAITGPTAHCVDVEHLA